MQQKRLNLLPEFKKIEMKLILFSLLYLLAVKHINGQSKTFEFPLRNGAALPKLYITHDRGNISIKGHDKQVFIITVEEATKSPLTVRIDSVVNGYPKLIHVSSEFRITQDKNELHIKGLTNSTSEKTYNLQIMVPYTCLIMAQINQQGEINLQQIKGTVNLTNKVGGITITKMSGSVIASAPNGKIDIAFDEISATKNSSITSLNKAIYISLPVNASAKLKVKSPGGKIVSAVKLEQENTNNQTKKEVQYDVWMTGNLNKGATEMIIQSMYGNIHIDLKTK